MTDPTRILFILHPHEFSTFITPEKNKRTPKIIATSNTATNISDIFVGITPPV